MKLFQRLLTAPAALGLMAPVAANADTAFSPTTTLSGSAVFTIGQVSDGGTADDQEELYMQYAYGVDINSSFTGKDLLYVGVETGNASGPLGNLDSAVGPDTNDVISVHSAFYSFPISDLLVTAGPLVDQDDVVAATTSAYSEAFRLGSMPYSLDGDLTGPGLGVAYAADNGIVASLSYVAIDGRDSTKGIGSDDADDIATFTFGYDGDGFGGGLVVAAHDGENTGTAASYSTFGAGIYYSPESIDATISIAYDSKDTAGTTQDNYDYFVGVDYEVGPGTLSAAYKSSIVRGNSVLDQRGYEVAYSYPVNDNLTFTPGFFTIEETTANQDDDTGVVFETAFSF
tara:strand:+ start:781 stop:1809 length:1029 start_codon:yes stop_codon:yes gene_type:complete